MSVEIGTAKISTLLGSNPPVREGKTAAGISNIATREDHVHPLLIAIGVFVHTDGYPCLESTSTLPYIWIPAGYYLGWDDVNQVFTYG